MKAWTDKLASFELPMWLVAALATVMAAWLLSTFIDTLREHLRHGDEMRQAQAAAARAPGFIVAADTTAARAAQLKLR